jgi:catechol 2,3-dioxygenase-like lactoylglutathione lyase family enzyme
MPVKNEPSRIEREDGMRAGQLVSVMLDVSDIDASKRFYGELLGLPLVAEFDDHVAVHSAGVSTVVLHAHDEHAERPGPAGLDDPSMT